MTLYTKEYYLLILLLSFLYPQWAMWANPSLPVGGSDTGIGLGVGEVMIFGDFGYQYFDWWHDIIPDAEEYDLEGNQYEHSGLFKNKKVFFI